MVNGTMSWEERIENYVRTTRFPRCIAYADGWATGIMMIGNNYQGRTGNYGEYPPTHLRRIRAVFPEVEALIGLVRLTNNRNRMIHIFRRITA